MHNIMVSRSVHVCAVVYLATIRCSSLRASSCLDAARPGPILSQDQDFPGTICPRFPQRATGLLNPFIGGAGGGEDSTSTPPGTEAR